MFKIPDSELGPEARKLRAWFEKEKRENGLLDIKFDGGLGLEMSGRKGKTTLEEFCKEVNSILEAKDIVPDPDFF